MTAQFQDGASVADSHRSRCEQLGPQGREWLDGARDLAPPLVQHQRRRRLLSLPPLLERRPVDAVRRRSRATSARCRPAKSSSARSSSCRPSARQLIADYRELLDTDEERAAYDQMIALAHRVFPYVEGHKFYCEHWYTNLFFNKIREFGALLAQHGFFADAKTMSSTSRTTSSSPRSST